MSEENKEVEHYCSFCTKPASDVNVLIASPEDKDGRISYICEGCVQTCYDVILKNLYAEITGLKNRLKEWKNNE